MKKVMFYCQHVLGMGHLVRSMALVEGLSQDFEVCFVNGGEIVEGFKVPGNINIVNLPPLKSDEDFGELKGQDGKSLAQIQHTRLQQLLTCHKAFQPDLLVVELFPFGRKKFAFELIPLLARIRLEGKTKVVCSLRDILVQKRDQAKHEASVCATLNRYFDTVLVHADPSFQRLDETFGAINHINIPIQYTGYVLQSEPEVSQDSIALRDDVPLLLASIGGGRVGVELLEASIEASKMLDFEHQLLIFTGPYLPEQDFSRLQKQVKHHSHIILKRFTANFLSYMKQASLSISMAGYNTCMNILSTGVQALVLPFSGGNNDEQASRAQKLEALGFLGILEADKLSRNYLAHHIKERLAVQSIPNQLNLQGVNTTREIVKNVLKMPKATVIRKSSNVFDPLIVQLENLQSKGQLRSVFLRNDDGDKDEDTLRQLFDITLSRQIPLHLAVIPASLTPAGLRLLKDLKRAGGELVELGQHGFQHINHELEGRKCEFGMSRNFDQQLEDISKGKQILEESLAEHFAPIFTPPWNRCTKDTFIVLDNLGFKILSKDTSTPATGYNFQEVSITLDLYIWKNGANMKVPEDIVSDLIKQVRTQKQVGLLLHHKVMNEEAFAFLDSLLMHLKQYSCIEFETVQSLALNQTLVGN